MGHPVFARVFAAMCPAMDRAGMGDRRRRLLEGLAGSVVEIGAGTGANFAHYPPSVTSVVAVEPEPRLREIARSAADAAAIDVELVDAVAESLPFGDGVFDHAVVTLALCSVDDPRRAIDEIYRVLRPGGPLHFIEHVRATTRGLRTVQRIADATLWPRLAGGCHTHRDVVGLIGRAGFDVVDLERYRFPQLPVPVAPHVAGVARRASSTTGTSGRDTGTGVGP